MYFGCLDLCFGCLDLCFGCLDLYFGCLDLYLGVWTYIWVSTHHPVVYVRAAGAFFVWKMMPPGFLSTYIVNLCDFHGFEAPLVFFSKSGQSDQMTMPARRASEFSAKRRAIMFLIIFQSLNSQAIPGFCEPWSECQPEESRNDADGDGGEPTTAMHHSHRQAITHRDKISRSGETPHSDI